MIGITKESFKTKLNHFGKTLKYSLHCIVSPFDGFWDLTHEKRGSAGAATFIMLMTILTGIWKTRYTSFVFIRVQWEYFNIIMDICSFLLPFFVWILSNWCLTTLFDGKGNMKDIYIGSCYALTPYVLIQLPMIFASNYITFEEGAFYNYFLTFSLIWCAFLFLASVMQIHDFSFGKALFSILCILVGMLVIVFLLVLFFSLFSDAIAFFVSLYKEIAFRFY
ncbi:MAG: YIP1 family protein [Lachnospiraceae bacterium]|nr:YIP1 family protein [Lachnospiraceae bacterium]